MVHFGCKDVIYARDIHAIHRHAAFKLGSEVVAVAYNRTWWTSDATTNRKSEDMMLLMVVLVLIEDLETMSVRFVPNVTPHA